MRDISLRNLTESRGFEDEKTEDAAHQCSACGMHDDICPSGQCTCSGGGTPENGVTAQEDTAATQIPLEGVTTITKGGNYEIPAGPYTGKIVINVTDTTQPVNIAIKGNITFNGPDPFIDVENAGIVNIKSEADYEVDCATYGKHFIMVASPSAQVTIEKGKYTSKGLNVGMVSAGTLTVNDAEMESNAYCLTASGSGRVIINGGTYIHDKNPAEERAVFWIFNGGHMTLNDVTATSEEPVILNSTGTVDVNGGDFKTTGTKSCFVNNSANLTINKGITTEGTFASEGASCIDNNWGQVRINGGSFTTDAGIAVKNHGGLRLNGGTVEAPNGTAIDISGESGDVQLNGGTIRNSVTGVRVADAGDSEIDLKAVTFENNTDDISLGNDQQINIKKSFAGTAKIRVDDPARGRQITTDNEDLSYQNKLKLFSMNSGYIIGYKRGDDGVEYRYLADANGNIVNAVNAKATANLGAGEQELDTATVVPENTTVTVTANLPEGAEGAEFLGWSAVRDDGKALDLGDEQTAHFKMPGCNVTVEALYQGGNVDPVNPGGGSSSDVVAGIAAVALTGAAVWGIYETGTGIYRVLNMPGVPMPSNRAGLATLIWEKAGCPEPQTVKSFSDIDDTDLHLRQAASWMEEQGLMDDVKENEFRPYRYVTKLQTCLVWDKAKEKSLIS
ncbi:Uncharacterised protein [uncultured Faecalibacterium sp.]|nr:Uncharacterised protein [uncultured Faecalibacterium sp.]